MAARKKTAVEPVFAAKGLDGFLAAAAVVEPKKSAAELRKEQRVARDARIADLCSKALPGMQTMYERGYSITVIAATVSEALGEKIPAASVRRLLAHPAGDAAAAKVRRRRAKGTEG